MSRRMYVHFEKKFENFEVNVELDYDLEKYHVIIGPSGSGKTLTLRFIAGLESGKGRVEFEGREITKFPPQRRRIVYIPQDESLFPTMTVQMNLLAGVKLGKSDFDRDLFERIVDVFKIEHLLDRYPSTLSAGEKQRVTLGRAIMVKPRLLLLDEPFSSLDFHIKLELIEFLKNVKKEFGTSFIHVTHDPIEAKLLAECVTVIEEGKVTYRGNFTTLVESSRSRFTERVSEFFSYLK